MAEKAGGELLELVREADSYLMIKPWSEIIGDEAAHIPSLIPGSVKEESTIINADSSPQRIAEIQQMLVSIHLMVSSEVDGAYGNPTRKAVIAFQQFVNEQRGAEILEITGECDALTMQYLQYCYDNGWDVGSAVNPPEPEPTEPPCAEPDEAAVSEIIGFTVEVDDYKNDGHIIELTPGKHSVSWSACSGVESFHVCLYDGDGNLMNSKTVSGDGDLTVKAADLVPGEIYRLEIGALPEGGSEADVIWQTIRITCSADAVLNPTREPEKTGVGKPVISLGSTAYQQNGIPYTSDDSITFNWMAEGDVEYYNVTLIYEDGTDYSLSNTTDTSKTVSAEQLIPGLWKLRIGAMPANGSEDDMKWNDMIFGVPGHEQDTSDEPEYAPDEDEPSGDCDEIIEYIDKDSAPEQIQLVQMELYKHGLIDPDDIAVGVLDEITIEAVLQFQMLVHEFYGIELEPIAD